MKNSIIKRCSILFLTLVLSLLTFISLVPSKRNFSAYAEETSSDFDISSKSSKDIFNVFHGLFDYDATVYKQYAPRFTLRSDLMRVGYDEQGNRLSGVENHYYNNVNKDATYYNVSFTNSRSCYLYYKAVHEGDCLYIYIPPFDSSNLYFSVYTDQGNMVNIYQWGLYCISITNPHIVTGHNGSLVHFMVTFKNYSVPFPKAGGGDYIFDFGLLAFDQVQFAEYSNIILSRIFHDYSVEKYGDLGFNSMYDAGYADGYGDGSADGYRNGLEENIDNDNITAFQDGYNKGYDLAKERYYTEYYVERYEEGKQDGIEIGYLGGYEEGQNFGYNNGWQDGNVDGLAVGYDSGYDSGYEDGYDKGVEDGYDDGYSVGLEENSSNVYFEAHQKGYSEGYDVGNRVGYSSGYTKGSKETGGGLTFFNLMASVIDAPIQAFAGLLNFEILGFNMSAFFTALLTACLIITVLKLLL